MDKYEIVRHIEKFAPLELAEDWDCSGWSVNNTSNTEICKVMICLTVTNNVIEEARLQHCKMIISHHPLFFVPLDWKDIDIYCAHTNMDKTSGGTTDELIRQLGMNVSETKEFLRYVETNITVENFIKKLTNISPNLRYVNNNSTQNLNKIAFCAGSGMEFIKEAEENGADAFVSGDLKFHGALDSKIVVFDIGHFESEILILKIFAEIIGEDVEKVFASERSPFIQNKY